MCHHAKICIHAHTISHRKVLYSPVGLILAQIAFCGMRTPKVSLVCITNRLKVLCKLRVLKKRTLYSFLPKQEKNRSELKQNEFAPTCELGHAEVKPSLRHLTVAHAEYLQRKSRGMHLGLWLIWYGGVNLWLSSEPKTLFYHTRMSTMRFN